MLNRDIRKVLTLLHEDFGEATENEAEAFPGTRKAIALLRKELDSFACTHVARDDVVNVILEKFQDGTIPGSIEISDERMDTIAGMFQGNDGHMDAWHIMLDYAIEREIDYEQNPPKTPVINIFDK